MSWELVNADCLEALRGMPECSVDCCVTSPPYYGLRDYGTATWEGGDSQCDHRQNIGGTRNKGRDRAVSGGKFHDSPKVRDELGIPFSGTCAKCGAVRVDKGIGLEPTFTEYLDRLVAVFGEVRRVLKPTGTLWLNMGDAYAGSWGAQSRGDGDVNGTSRLSGGQMYAAPKGTHTGSAKRTGLKPKDLIGQPWRLAFALQEQGWWLRSDIVWAKPNPMPESVRDRPTRSHEYVFLLTKQSRYWYDADAIADPAMFAGRVLDYTGDQKNNRTDPVMQATRPKDRKIVVADTRNARTVWTIPTQAYPEAHFATFPEELPKRCVLAGCPVGGLVLDPFAGSGTTLAVAVSLGRKAVGVELNPEYVALAEKRLAKVTPSLFSEESA